MTEKAPQDRRPNFLRVRGRIRVRSWWT